MPSFQTSTLLLTLLLAVGLVFFLRAASKDRTTVVDVASSKPPLEVMEGLSHWLESRGWSPRGGDAARQVLRFEGKVAASIPLAALLALLGSIGASSLGLVVRELQPNLGWWPLLLAGLGPLAGVIYRRRASRTESVEIRLMNQPDQSAGSTIRLRAHRDELIALELELAGPLDLASDGALLSSPI